MAAPRQVRVRTRRRSAEVEDEGDAIREVKSWWLRPLSEYRKRTVVSGSPLIVQFPLFFAELREIKRTKVYRKCR